MSGTDTGGQPEQTVSEETNSVPAAPEASENAGSSQNPPPAPAAPVAPVAPAASEAPSTPAAEATDAAAEAPKPGDEDSKLAPVVAPTPLAQLWSLAEASGHPEIWGVTLADPDSHVPTQIVLQKFLNANDGDLEKAKNQLTETLNWRAKNRPLELVKKTFSKAKFEGLGYVTVYVQEGSTEPDGKEVFTWNIYGAVKDMDQTFGDLAEFLEWRVALMELALQELDIASATKPITADYDPYKIFQVHDYQSISFLRQNPKVKTASKQTIEVFAANYPELLKEKFFVNVPAIMGFFYTFMKLFVAPKTIRKFHPMANGQNLAREFAESKVAGLGEKLPANYGGKGAELAEQGKGPQLQ
ncbi:hypothetical protein VTK56DRAFT_4071 [Thermocarpiscus australiensis]